MEIHAAGGGIHYTVDQTKKGPINKNYSLKINDQFPQDNFVYKKKNLFIFENKKKSNRIVQDQIRKKNYFIYTSKIM